MQTISTTIRIHNRDWIPSVPFWPSEFTYKSFEQVGKELSILLRDSEGQHKCDIIIALTHSR